MGSFTVLVVDDLPTILDLYRDSFELFFGWEVLLAGGVRPASDLLEIEIVRIGAVVCDYSMGGPGQDGPDLFAQWSEKLAERGIPFFLVSGGDERGLPDGMIVARKPISMKELGRLIQIAAPKGSRSSEPATRE